VPSIDGVAPPTCDCDAGWIGAHCTYIDFRVSFISPSALLPVGMRFVPLSLRSRSCLTSAYVVGNQNLTLALRGFTNDTQLFVMDQEWPFLVLRALGTFQPASDVLRFALNETRLEGGYSPLQLVKTVEGQRINHTRNDLLYFHPSTTISCLDEGRWFSDSSCQPCPAGGGRPLRLRSLSCCFPDVSFLVRACV
jgi:hypothetical protein